MPLTPLRARFEKVATPLENVPEVPPAAMEPPVPEAIDALWPLAAVLLGTLSWGVSQAMIRLLGRDDGPTTIGALTAYAAPQLLVASLLFERGQIVERNH